MMRKLTRSMGGLRRYLRDQSGTVSVEFVLIFPILALWLALSFLFFDAFKSNSQTEKVAFTIADIMSRHEKVDDTDMTYLAALQDKMLPRRLDQRATRITSICYEDETYKVMWSYAVADEGVTGFTELNDDTIPLDIMPALSPQDSVILTEVRARWSPMVSIGGLKDQIWVNALVNSPRFNAVRIIPHAQLNPSTLCPRTVGTGEGGSGGGGGDDGGGDISGEGTDLGGWNDDDD